jgi:H+-transporting ATPase
MRVVLGVATVLGLVGPIAAFGLFAIADRVFKLGNPQIQTMMYLMLSVAGHLTIFQTRTRGPWWSTRPAWIVLAAVCGTQIFATLVSVYGAGLVAPLGWYYAGIVWAYAFTWFLVTDPIKLLTYWVLDAMQAKAGLARPSGSNDSGGEGNSAEPGKKGLPPDSERPASPPQPMPPVKEAA